VSPVVLKAMKKGNLKYFVSGERSRALWALLFFNQMCVSPLRVYLWHRLLSDLCKSTKGVLVASFIYQMCVSPLRVYLWHRFLSDVYKSTKGVLVASFIYQMCVSPLRVYLWHRF